MLQAAIAQVHSSERLGVCWQTTAGVALKNVVVGNVNYACGMFGFSLFSLLLFFVQDFGNLFANEIASLKAFAKRILCFASHFTCHRKAAYALAFALILLTLTFITVVFAT